MRLTLTPFARRVGHHLRKLSGAQESRPGIEFAVGPFFANNMAELRYRDDAVHLQIEQSTPNDDGGPELSIVADLQLVSSPSSEPTESSDR